MSNYTEMARGAISLARTLTGMVGLSKTNGIIEVAEKVVEVADTVLPILQERDAPEAEHLKDIRDKLREKVRQAARDEADRLEG